MSLRLLVRLVSTWMKSRLKCMEKREGRARQVQGRLPLGAECRQGAHSLRDLIMDVSDLTFKKCSHYFGETSSCL